MEPIQIIEASRGHSRGGADSPHEQRALNSAWRSHGDVGVLGNQEIVTIEHTLAEVAAQAQIREHRPKRLIAMVCDIPPLAARVLTSINSSRFGLYEDVRSIRHAVVVLGPNTFRQLVWETVRVNLRAQGRQGGWE